AKTTRGDQWCRPSCPERRLRSIARRSRRTPWRGWRDRRFERKELQITLRREGRTEQRGGGACSGVPGYGRLFGRITESQGAPGEFFDDMDSRAWRYIFMD